MGEVTFDNLELPDDQLIEQNREESERRKQIDSKKKQSVFEKIKSFFVRKTK